MSFHQNKPDEIFKEELNDLHSAVKDAGHDYHLFTIATVNDKTPEIRTVVLRDFNIKKYQISFHTDARSPKYSQVKSNPAISALFYSTQKRTQLRLHGNATICKDQNLLNTLWSKLNKDSRECYQGEVPPSGNIPKSKIINDTSSEMSGFENFSRLSIEISTIEILRLHHLGHKRLLCDVLKDPIDFQWIAS
jgi:hypothetical protein